LWAERYEEVRPLLDTSIAEARATGDCGRLAVGLAHRAWLALRRGDLNAAEGDTRAALGMEGLPAPTLYRVLNGGILIDTLVERGDLEEAEGVLATLDDETQSGSLTAAVLRYGRGRLRVAEGQTRAGLDDLLGVGALANRALVRCPSYLAWRSEAALAHLAVGDVDAARRLAEEEVELARAFGTPRALGVALRAAAVVARGHAGERLLREALDVLGRAQLGLEHARASTDLGALLRRANHRAEPVSTCAPRSTSRTARARSHWPSGRRQNCAQPAPGRGGSCSAGSNR